MSIAEKAPFQLQRIGSVMEPDPNDPLEAWGVLNPASARSPEGDLFLYPRVVAEGNYSRIGKARVLFDGRGEPRGVERMGYVLEPEERYERSMRTHGGVEDPRVTFVEPLGLWAMVYTAVSSVGPRVAVAVSRDLHTWHRLGLLKYQKTCAVSFNQYGNKDGMFFPDVVLDPKGNPALAILHRPTYQVHRPDGTVLLEVPCDIEESRESIWIAYISLEKAKEDIRKLVYVYGNELLAAPVEQWECLKIGGGTPPVKIPGGWLTYYHGVSGNISLDPAVTKNVCYSAGALVLDPERPTTILYRSREPVLSPERDPEQHGIVPNVVFPTAADVRENGEIDVYYGMADSSIGVARTRIPDQSDWLRQVGD
jgi:predicted GH43/DUF377 family glycosyl hydrolase